MKHLFLLLTLCLPLIASKEPPLYEGKTAKVYLGNYAKAKTKEERQKALQSLFNFKPSTLRDDDYEAIVSIVANLQEDDPALLGRIKINEPWQVALAKSQSENEAIASAAAKPSAPVAKKPDSSAADLKHTAATARASAADNVVPTSRPSLPGHASLKPSSSASAAASASAADKEHAAGAAAKPAKGIGEEDVKAGSNRLKLTSKEGKEIFIDRAVAIDLSNLVKTALENDDKADEVPVPAVPTHTLQALVSLMKKANEITTAPGFEKRLKDYADAWKMKLTPGVRERATLAEIASKIVDTVDIELILAANYMDTPLLLKALIYAYTRKLIPAVGQLNAERIQNYKSDNPTNLTGQLMKKHPELTKLPKELLTLLGKYCSLVYPENPRRPKEQRMGFIDTYLGLAGNQRPHVTVEELSDFGLLHPNYLKNFPGLAENVNALSEDRLTDEPKTALVEAANDDLQAVIGLLHVRGINPNIPALTPLMSASSGGHIEMVDALLHASAYPNVPDIGFSGGKKLQRIPAGTALMRAVDEGYTDIVRLLLAAGAQPDMQDKDGYTALIKAALHNRVEIIKLILQRKPDLSLTTKRKSAYRPGYTALGWAAKEGAWDAALELLKAGANPDDLVGIAYGPRSSTNPDGPSEKVITYLKSKGRKDIATEIETGVSAPRSSTK